MVLKDAFGATLEAIAGNLSTSVGAVKAALHRGRGKLAEPDPETPRAPIPQTLDAFCRAFNEGDLDRVAALLLDEATVEVVGASTLYGSKKARPALNGMMFGSRRMAAVEDGGTCNGIDPHFVQGALPTPARVEVHWVRGEPLLFSWYQHQDGEFVRAVTRVELDEATGRIAHVWNYFFTPEVIAELCAELQLPCRTNGNLPRARRDGRGEGVTMKKLALWWVCVALIGGAAHGPHELPAKVAAKTGYANVNGLRMYYEVHGPTRASRSCSCTAAVPHRRHLGKAAAAAGSEPSGASPWRSRPTAGRATAKGR